MKSAQELKDKYENDLKELQNKCKHEKTVWCIEEWAPAHRTGWEVLTCKNCWKKIERKVNCINCGKLLRILEDDYQKKDIFDPIKQFFCNKKCKDDYNNSLIWKFD